MMLPAENINGRASPYKIIDHLPGDFLRISAHPFLCYSVIGGKNKDGWIGKRRSKRSLDQADLYSDLLQPSQRTNGFCLPVNFLPEILLQFPENAIYLIFSHG